MKKVLLTLVTLVLLACASSAHATWGPEGICGSETRYTNTHCYAQSEYEPEVEQGIAATANITVEASELAEPYNEIVDSEMWVWFPGTNNYLEEGSMFGTAQAQNRYAPCTWTDGYTGKIYCDIHHFLAVTRNSQQFIYEDPIELEPPYATYTYEIRDAYDVNMNEWDKEPGCGCVHIERGGGWKFLWARDEGERLEEQDAYSVLVGFPTVFEGVTVGAEFGDESPPLAEGRATVSQITPYPGHTYPWHSTFFTEPNAVLRASPGTCVSQPSGTTAPGDVAWSACGGTGTHDASKTKPEKPPKEEPVSSDKQAEKLAKAVAKLDGGKGVKVEAVVDPPGVYEVTMAAKKKPFQMTDDVLLRGAKDPEGSILKVWINEYTGRVEGRYVGNEPGEEGVGVKWLTPEQEERREKVKCGVCGKTASVRDGHIDGLIISTASGPPRHGVQQEPTDKPILGARIVLKANGHALRVAYTDSAGRFAFKVPRGEYTVLDEGCTRPVPVRVRAGRTSYAELDCGF
jgi:hypothetical protein